MLSSITGAARHAGLLGAVLLTSAVISGLVVATGGLLDRHAVEGVRAEFATRSGDDRALRLSLPLAGDADAQDAGVRSALDLDFARVDAPIAIDRVVEGRVELSSDDGRASVIAEALSIEGFPERAALVAGDWAGAEGLTMQADAAEALDLEPGAVVEVSGERFTLTGTWRITDRLDPRWTDPRLMAEASVGDRAAVVVLDESSWARLAAEPKATWSLEPSIRDLTVSDLTTIPPVWSRLSGSLRDALGGLEGLERDSDFVRAAEEIGARVAGLDAVEPVALLLLGALGLATLAQLARLLALERQDETRLIWSRGASTPGLVARAAGESGAIALLGAALGTGLAVAALAASGEPPGLTAARLITPGAVVATIAALFAAVRMWALVRRLETDRVGATSRAAGTTWLGLLALTAGAAALSTWQLLLYGSPLTPDAQGGLSVDPITVAAPALIVIAGVLAAAALAPLAARLLDRPGGRTPVTRVLAVASVARRPETATASVVTSALAVAAIVLAAGYGGTWALAFDRSAASQAGASATAVAPAPIDLAMLEAIGAAPEVDAVAPILVEEIQLDDEAVSLVAASPDAVQELAGGAALPDPGTVADALRIDVPGPRLPESTTELVLTASATGFASPPAITLLVADSLGAIRPLPLEVRAGGTLPDTLAYAATLPEALRAAPAPLQVLALEAEIAEGDVAPGVGAVWELLALDASTEAAEGEASTPVELDPFWGPVSPVPQQPAPEVTVGGRGFLVDALARSIRLTPPLDSAVEIPVVVSRAVAERSQVGVGDAIRVRGLGSVSLLRGVVAAIVEAVPSSPTPRAVLIDLGVVRNAQLVAPAAVPPTSAVWVSGADAAEAGEAARVELPAGTRVDDVVEAPTRGALAGAVTALWLAAAGATLLALVTVAASARAQRRGRLGEVAILRALGVRARDQGAIRGRELALTSTAGVVAGLAAGAAVVLVAVAPFARAAIPVSAPLIATPVAVDAVIGCAALAAVVLGLAAIAAATAATVRRDARTVGGEELDR